MKNCPGCEHLLECLGSWSKWTYLVPCYRCHRLFITHRLVDEAEPKLLNREYRQVRRSELAGTHQCWRVTRVASFYCTLCLGDFRKRNRR
jgi:hypothetical protein